MFNRHLLPVLAIPSWLLNLTCAEMEQGTFPLRDLLRDSFYYPASGFDGTPVKYFAGHFLSFVYVDYGRTCDDFKRELEHPGFDGYELVGFRSVGTQELAPEGWRPMPPDPVSHTGWIQNPFGVWSVFQRRDDVPEDHGPSRFSLVYLCADGVAAFQAFYVTNAIAPKAMAIVQPGVGILGGNYTRFKDPEEILFRSVLLTSGGLPDILVYGGNGDLTWYQQACWPEYQRHVLTFSLPNNRHRHISVWQKEVDPQPIAVRVRILRHILRTQTALTFPGGWENTELSRLSAQIWKTVRPDWQELFQLKVAKRIVRRSSHVVDGLEAVLDQWIQERKRRE